MIALFTVQLTAAAGRAACLYIKHAAPACTYASAGRATCSQLVHTTICVHFAWRRRHAGARVRWQRRGRAAQAPARKVLRLGQHCRKEGLKVQGLTNLHSANAARLSGPQVVDLSSKRCHSSECMQSQSQPTWQLGHLGAKTMCGRLLDISVRTVPETSLAARSRDLPTKAQARKPAGTTVA